MGGRNVGVASGRAVPGMNGRAAVGVATNGRGLAVGVAPWWRAPRGAPGTAPRPPEPRPLGAPRAPRPGTLGCLRPGRLRGHARSLPAPPSGLDREPGQKEAAPRRRDTLWGSDACADGPGEESLGWSTPFLSAACSPGRLLVRRQSGLLAPGGFGAAGTEHRPCLGAQGRPQAAQLLPRAFSYRSRPSPGRGSLPRGLVEVCWASHPSLVAPPSL